MTSTNFSYINSNNNHAESQQGSASTSSVQQGTTATKTTAGQTMMQSLSSQWKNSKSSREQMLKKTQYHREQMKQGLQTLGTKLQQGSQELMATNEAQRLKEQLQSVVGTMKRSKFTEGTTSTTTTSSTKGGVSFTDQLEMFNERMKEEALRRDVRREAEEACLKTMRDHLSEFLVVQQQQDQQQDQREGKTYEEWIFALHPENTQDATLLHDMEYKEVDSRFYVEESDHRQLWNETVKDPHRQVAARTSMWNSSNSTKKVQQHQQQPMVDLLGSDDIQNLSRTDLDSVSKTTTKTTTTIDPFDHATGRSVTEELPAMDPTVSIRIQQDGDLISF